MVKIDRVSNASIRPKLQAPEPVAGKPGRLLKSCWSLCYERRFLLPQSDIVVGTLMRNQYADTALAQWKRDAALFAAARISTQSVNCCDSHGGVRLAAVGHA